MIIAVVYKNEKQIEKMPKYFDLPSYPTEVFQDFFLHNEKPKIIRGVINPKCPPNRTSQRTEEYKPSSVEEV